MILTLKEELQEKEGVDEEVASNYYWMWYVQKHVVYVHVELIDGEGIYDDIDDSVV